MEGSGRVAGQWVWWGRGWGRAQKPRWRVVVAGQRGGMEGGRVG